MRGQEGSGEFMDGSSAALTPVRLVPDIAALKIVVAASGDTLACWPQRSIRVESLSGGLFHLRHEGEPALITTRDAAVVAWVGGAPAPSRGRQLLVYGGAFAAALVALYLSLPLVAGAIARRVPPSVEEKLATQIQPLLARSRCQSREGDAALETLVHRLGGSADVQVWVVDDGMVNAFALPGGRIVIMRGLLDKAEHPEEVAGVLAHELAHVSHRHVMTQIVRSTILSALWAVTLGDYSGLLVVDPSVAYQIGMRRFSRDDEREADRGALTALDAAGISREGYAAFFRRMKSETDKVPAFLSTHPASEERLRLIERDARQAPTTPALPAQAWSDLRGICKGR